MGSVGMRRGGRADRRRPPVRAAARVRPVVTTLLATAVLLGSAAPADAQIQRHPTGVNVNASGATTVFITFGGLEGYVPVEAAWCGELIDATPDIGDRCDPGTIFGHLPLRFDRSRRSGADGLTDIMSIPPSVARRAWQDAAEGANSAFFYVRRFVDPTGLGPDQYVSVTCRLAGGGARVPFALLDVRVEFDGRDPVLSLEPGTVPPPIRARIAYNGTGRLVGRWEVVLPGEEPPTSEDLLTEGTLPVELRGTQRRYTELERFNVFAPPTGELVLEGPDPEKLPTHAKGLYRVLLRIEATDDKEGDSSLESAGSGTGLVHTGGVAGFPIPALRYHVGTAGASGAVTGRMELSRPEAGGFLPTDGPLVFSWTRLSGAALYRIEIRNGEGEEVLAALRQPLLPSYHAPDWLRERVGADLFTWRVVALDGRGDPIAATEWREARIGVGT